MIEQIWKILTTLTEEAKQAALSKSTELGLDQNRGIVSLAESFINLTLATNILIDAIEKEKLIQLPITIQKDLLSNLDSIAEGLQNLIAGRDEIKNLTDSIEKLNLYIWQYGLNRLSDEVLGYEQKLNQLKQLELEAKELKNELRKGITLKNQLEKIFQISTEKSDLINQKVNDSDANIVKLNDFLSQAQTTAQAISALHTTAQQNDTTSTQLLAATKQANADALAFKTQISDLVVNFSSLKTELEESEKKKIALFEEFESYRETINGLLGDANRTGMAGAFYQRSKDLRVPAFGWVILFGMSIFGLVIIGNHYFKDILNNATFEQLALRFALSAPLIWLGWFSAKQYGYTTRLREDYAYKTASAMSFEGYKREAGEIKPEMLESLLDTAIKNFGENPVRIYSIKDNHASPLNEILDKSLKDEKFIDLLKAMIKKVTG